MTDLDSDEFDDDDPVVHAAWVAAMDGCGGGCGAFLPGHQVHWIQARKAMAEPARPARVIDLDGHRATLLFDDGSTEVVWHHRPLTERLSVGQVVDRRKYGVLALPEKGLGTPLLCLRRELP